MARTLLSSHVMHARALVLGLLVITVDGTCNPDHVNCGEPGGRLPSESCTPAGSVADCGECMTSDQCVAGFYCCPWMKKCKQDNCGGDNEPECSCQAQYPIAGCGEDSSNGNCYDRYVSDAWNGENTPCDCASADWPYNWANGPTCLIPGTCDDGMLNQDEEDIDCGGGCPFQCDDRAVVGGGPAGNGDFPYICFDGTVPQSNGCCFDNGSCPSMASEGGQAVFISGGCVCMSSQSIGGVCSCTGCQNCESATTGTDASGNDASGNGASGNDASGNVASGNDASGNDASGNDASGNDASGNDASGNDASGNDASGNDASGNSGNDVNADTDADNGESPGQSSASSADDGLDGAIIAGLISVFVVLTLGVIGAALYCRAGRPSGGAAIGAPAASVELEAQK